MLARLLEQGPQRVGDLRPLFAGEDEPAIGRGGAEQLAGVVTGTGVEQGPVLVREVGVGQVEKAADEAHRTVPHRLAWMRMTVGRDAGGSRTGSACRRSQVSASQALMRPLRSAICERV